MNAPDAARPAESVEGAALLEAHRRIDTPGMAGHVQYNRWWLCACHVDGRGDKNTHKRHLADVIERSLTQARAEGAQAVVDAVEATASGLDWEYDARQYVNAARAAAQQATTGEGTS